MASFCRTIKNGSGGKGDAIQVTYEKDEVYGTVARRTLAYTRPMETEPTVVVRRAATQSYPEGPMVRPEEPHPFGPEAEARAREMEYELTTRIQQESPYMAERVVRYTKPNPKLYWGMWAVGGLNAVAAFLTFDLVHAMVAAVAVAIALMTSPGDQADDLPPDESY